MPDSYELTVDPDIPLAISIAKLPDDFRTFLKSGVATLGRANPSEDQLLTLVASTASRSRPNLKIIEEASSHLKLSAEDASRALSVIAVISSLVLTRASTTGAELVQALVQHKALDPADANIIL